MYEFGICQNGRSLITMAITTLFLSLCHCNILNPSTFDGRSWQFHFRKYCKFQFQKLC